MKNLGEFRENRISTSEMKTVIGGGPEMLSYCAALEIVASTTSDPAVRDRAIELGNAFHCSGVPQD